MGYNDRAVEIFRAQRTACLELARARCSANLAADRFADQRDIYGQLSQALVSALVAHLGATAAKEALRTLGESDELFGQYLYADL